MAVNLNHPVGLKSVVGIRLAAVEANLRYAGRPDLCLVEISPDGAAAAVFTRNAFRAAPVLIAQQHLADNMPRYLLINAGNANAGTGPPGMEDAVRCCQALAELAGCDTREVLPFSTGVIGERMPVDKLTAALPGLKDRLSPDNWLLAAQAMMTTDTVPKAISRSVVIGGREVVITGMAKGSGMIRPDMATMLAFVATDAIISPAVLTDLLGDSTDRSFNRITVDGDTSTNDACVLIATGASGASVDTCSPTERERFRSVLLEVMQYLAQAIVRDAEGATKFVNIKVAGAASDRDADLIAYTIAHSPLVKTALFASDPNWGRVLAAVGRAGAETLDIERVDIFFDDVAIVRNGAVATDYDESAAERVLAAAEFGVRVELNSGGEQAEIWTCDLSHDYVRINAEYRS